MVTQGVRAVVSPGRTWIKPFKKKKTFRKIIITGETFAIFNLLVSFFAGTYLNIRKIRKKEVLGPVARSLVSANRWLRGIKMYRFPWYLTLVSTNHASSNPGQAPVVQKVDNTIHRINHYPLDSAIGFPNTYPLDSDSSGG